MRLSGGITSEELAVWEMDYNMATIQVRVRLPDPALRRGC